MSKLPILVTFYNRPKKLEKLLLQLKFFDNIELYFAGDGPKNQNDKKNVDKCWSLIKQHIKNENVANTLVRSQNLGCAEAMKSNLDWFFDSVAFGLILEDDCIPAPDFVNFLIQNLKVLISFNGYMCISGFDPTKSCNTIDTFRTSNFTLIWGWATWKKVWNLYKFEIFDSDDISTQYSKIIFPWYRPISRFLFKSIFTYTFNQVNRGKIETWDYSLIASMWRNRMKSLQINGNQIINIGFDHLATHTKKAMPKWVPVEYGKKPANNCLVSNHFELKKDQWIARKIYRINTYNFVKIQITKFLRS